MQQWYILSSESPGVLRDENGVPVEWTLLSVGANAFCQEGVDGALTLTASVEELSKEAGIPSHHIYRIFREKMNCSPAFYMKQVDF
ncbi:MAG: helix-turn-helix transcriptional regulator [Lentisphaeria bacterium]|nr:helix-turn-helix transcriptional regulator [Lentisphaeria bacterium]